MRCFITIFLAMTLFLFAQDQALVINSLWLAVSLLSVVLMFWSIYKAMKTKNPKYGWGMGLSLVLLVVLLFV